MIRYRTDTGKWEVRWRENVRHRSRSFTLEKDAKRFAAKVQRARETGDMLDADRGKETVAEFMERWWGEYALTRLEKNTRDGYARVWEKHIRRRVGGYRLRDVSPAVADRLKSELIAANVGAPTIRKGWALLSSMMRCAVTWDRLDRNPFLEVKAPKVKRTRHVRPIAPQYVEAMRAGLLARAMVRDAAFVAVLAYGGLRPEEARALRWRISARGRCMSSARPPGRTSRRRKPARSGRCDC